MRIKLGPVRSGFDQTGEVAKNRERKKENNFIQRNGWS